MLIRDRSTQIAVNANQEVYKLLKDGINVEVPDERGGTTTERVRLIEGRVVQGRVQTGKGGPKTRYQDHLMVAPPAFAGSTSGPFAIEVPGLPSQIAE
jgi:hypothetical protein